MEGEGGREGGGGMIGIEVLLSEPPSLSLSLYSVYSSTLSSPHHRNGEGGSRTHITVRLRKRALALNYS